MSKGLSSLGQRLASTKVSWCSTPGSPASRRAQCRQICAGLDRRPPCQSQPLHNEPFILSLCHPPAAAIFLESLLQASRMQRAELMGCCSHGSVELCSHPVQDGRAHVYRAWLRPKVTADALRKTRASGHAIPVTGSVVSTHHPWLNKLFIFVPSPTPTLPDVGELRI